MYATTEQRKRGVNNGRKYIFAIGLPSTYIAEILLVFLDPNGMLELQNPSFLLVILVSGLLTPLIIALIAGLMADSKRDFRVLHAMAFSAISALFGFGTGAFGSMLLATNLFAYASSDLIFINIGIGAAIGGLIAFFGFVYGYSSYIDTKFKEDFIHLMLLLHALVSLAAGFAFSSILLFSILGYTIEILTLVILGILGVYGIASTAVLVINRGKKDEDLDYYRKEIIDAAKGWYIGAGAGLALSITYVIQQILMS